MIFHFVYKTSHANGRFYIGRHITENLDDGYFGSGVWVQGIKDKTSLSREILVFATNIENLHLLETEYIQLYYNNELCMNIMPNSKGHDSISARENMRMIAKKGNHPWQKYNSNQIRVSCLACKKELNWPVYSYAHGENCKELNSIIEVKLPGQGFKSGHASRAGRTGGKIGGEYAKNNKIGIHSLSKEKDMIRIFNSQIAQAIRSGKASVIENPKIKEWPFNGVN